MMMMPELWIHA